jgi:predicted permease
VIGTITLATLTRLVVAPFIILGLLTLLGITGLMRNVILVQLSTPTAVYATLLATEFGSDAQFTTSVIFITTIASLLSLSIIMALVVV